MNEIDHDDAVDALKELGLSTYEARVFMALVQLGSGTASDVAEISDVPRSQVYSTAQELEDHGLISRQRSSPQVFRPVTLDEAKAQLEHQFEKRRDTAFDYLERLEQQSTPSSEQSEDVWSITGRDAVTERIVQLVKNASERIVYGSATLSDADVEILEAFDSRCDAGVEIDLVREADQTLPPEWGEIACLTDLQLPQEWQSNDYVDRMLVVDSDVFLFSIRPRLGTEESEEIAIWSAHTTFATAFSQLMIDGFPESVQEAIGAEYDGFDSV